MIRTNDQPLISIIIPIYNTREYLDRCIGSVVTQTYQNTEILLINDGSTDGSSFVFDDWGKKDQRIKVIHKKNEGLSKARNDGLDIMHGDYIFFVDSDDWIDEKVLEVLLKHCLNDAVDVACCSIVIENEGSPTNKRSTLFTENETLELYGDDIQMEYMNGKSICSVVWNKLYRSDLFNNIRFPIGPVHEDEYTTYKVLSRAKKVIYTPEICYRYFQHSNSVMKTRTEKAFFDILDAFKQRSDFYNSNNKPLLYDVSIQKSADMIKYILFHEKIKINKTTFIKLKEKYASVCRLICNNPRIATFTKVKFRIWKLLIYLKSIRYLCKNQAY